MRTMTNDALNAFLDALVLRIRVRPRDAILTPEVMADIVSTARRDLEAKPAMPEEFRIGGHGDLIAPDNELVMRGSTLRQYGADTIRAAVEAWLDEMERRAGA